MKRKAKKIGDTCNATIILYNEIKSQLGAIREMNKNENEDEHI